MQFTIILIYSGPSNHRDYVVYQKDQQKGCSIERMMSIVTHIMIGRRIRTVFGWILTTTPVILTATEVTIWLSIIIFVTNVHIGIWSVTIPGSTKVVACPVIIT